MKKNQKHNFKINQFKLYQFNIVLLLKSKLSEEEQNIIIDKLYENGYEDSIIGTGINNKIGISFLRNSFYPEKSLLYYEKDLIKLILNSSIEESCFVKES